MTRSYRSSNLNSARKAGPISRLRLSWCSSLILILWACFPVLAGEGDLVWLLGTDPNLYRGLEGHPTAVITNRGIVATLSASDGVLRHTRTIDVGVDSAERNDRHGIDPGEYIDIAFDRHLMFTAFFVGSWSKKSGDKAVIKLHGAEMAVIERTGYQPVTPFFIPSGSVLRFEGLRGASRDKPNGWSLTSFSTSLP